MQRSQVLSQWYQGWVQSSISPDGRFIVFESGRGQWDIEVDRGSNIELDIPDGAPASGSFPMSLP